MMNHNQLSLAHIPLMDANPSVTKSEPVLQLIAGDASDRKFYRLKNADFSAICMQFPKWDGGYGGDPLSWLGMHKTFGSVGIPVPNVLKVDPEGCCIWTEDFGDNFLNYKLGDRVLDKNDPAAHQTIEFYKQAIDLLILAQYPKAPLEDHPARERFFDFEKLMFEMDFFLKHFVGGFLGLTADDNKHFPVQAMRDELAELCTELGARPRVLTHRDYHVRNVMIVDDKAKWIDFQDARMGPHTYDVVSLLRDSYVKIELATRNELSEYYFSKLNAARASLQMKSMDSAEYASEFALMGLQRNIKAVGSFGYLASIKSKPSYLKYVKHTTKNILAPEAKAAGTRDLTKSFPRTFDFFAELERGRMNARFEKCLQDYKVFESF